MYWCLCNAVTEEDLKKYIEEFHITKVKDLVKAELVGGYCNKCMKPTVKLLKELKESSCGT